MTGMLLSPRVAELYGRGITDVVKRHGRELDIETCNRVPSPSVMAQIEIAFYSRDLWHGCDKTFLNEETLTFFRVVDALPNLHWLHITSAGIDLPMYQPSVRRGVRITTSSGSNAEPIAQTAVANLLSLARGMPHWAAAQRNRVWSPVRGTLPRDLRGQVAVIVGTGAIGSEIARLLQAVGLRTIGVRRSAVATRHFDEVLSFAHLDEALPRADWLIIACPLSDITRGLIDARRVGMLPPTAHFINVARGEIVDETALTEALAARHIAGAYLDVFCIEPLPDESPLWTLPNVIMTPHDCSASQGNFGRGCEIFVRNLDAYLDGRPMENEFVRQR